MFASIERGVEGVITSHKGAMITQQGVIVFSLMGVLNSILNVLFIYLFIPSFLHYIIITTITRLRATGGKWRRAKINVNDILVT